MVAMGKGWSEDDDIALRKMVSEGFSANQIGLCMGNRSRSAVLGRCHRLDLHIGSKTYPSRSPVRKPKEPSPIQNPAPGPKPKIVKDTFVPPKTDSLGPISTEMSPTTFECRSVPMLEVRDGQCMWPVNAAGKGEEHLFCGNATGDILSKYCQPHKIRAAGRGTESERMAVKVLERARA